MAKSLKRRRLEAKTDYHARLALLKSEIPRLVIRKTNRYIIAQVVSSDIAQDKVQAGAISKDLLLKGWPKEKAGSLKSIPAAYLTGFMLAKAAQQKKIKKVILDMGMHRNVHGSRIYAVVKGALDAGIEIPFEKDALPNEARIAESKIIDIKKMKEKL